MGRYLFIFGLTGSSLLLATQVVWVQFQLNHTYSDSTTNCESARMGSPFYFAMEIENGKATRAAFNSNMRPRGEDSRTVLTHDELKEIEFFLDSQGRYWVKRLPLTSRLIRWILFVTPQWGVPQFCVLPQPLKTTSPGSVLFEFGPEDLEEFQFAHSRKISLSGARLDGGAFRAKMQLVQREFRFQKW